MATRTATATGNASNTATWGGNPIPGDGDTVVVPSGITVTFDQNFTVGTATAGVTAVSTTGSGIVSIASGVKLTLKGHCDITGELKINGINAGIEYDSPIGTQYRLSANYGAKITVTGTDNTQRCYIRSKVGGGRAYWNQQAAATTSAGTISLTNLNVTRFGDLSNPGFMVSVQDTSTFDCLLTNVTFSDCGVVWQRNQNANSKVKWDNVLIETPVGSQGISGMPSLSYPLAWLMGGNDLATGGSLTRGERTLNNVRCQGRATFVTAGYTTSNIVITEEFDMSAGTLASANNWFMRHIAVNEATFLRRVRASGTWSNTYVFVSEDITNNYHGVGVTPIANFTFDGWIFDAAGLINNTDVGECFTVSNPASAMTGLWRNCIGLPSRANQSGQSYKASIGALIWSGATLTNLTTSAEHNTHYSTFAVGADAALCACGETFAPRSGQYDKVRANIVWGGGAGLAWLVYDRGTGNYAAKDLVSDGSYNCTYLAGASRSPLTSFGYFVAVTSATPGTGDIQANPNFNAPDRNFATWAATRGATGTDAQKHTAAIGYLLEDGTRVAELLAHVRAGFRPKNNALRGASYSGDAQTTDAAGNPWFGATPDMGAMAWIASASGPATQTIGLGRIQIFGAGETLEL